MDLFVRGLQDQAPLTETVDGERTMPVLGLQHVNIRTSDLARTIAFFRDVLAMKVGPSPRSTSMENGAWVFDDNGTAVIHVAKASMVYPSDSTLPFTPSHGSGAIHHVALRCTGDDEIRNRIQALGLEFHENRMPQLHQILVMEPNGILFELNFPVDAL
jgi:catechol 2,3-dioxygenase-like lactoylglutathione lyase family enzyme